MVREPRNLGTVPEPEDTSSGESATDQVYTIPLQNRIPGPLSVLPAITILLRGIEYVSFCDYPPSPPSDEIKVFFLL